MRERHALRALRKIQATQSTLTLVSEAALARALDLERARDGEVRDARARLDGAIEDWRRALAHGHIDASLLGLFAKAPPLREADLKAAQVRLEHAQRQTELDRTRHGENCARLRRSSRMHSRLRKRLGRKVEDKALATLEYQPREPAP